MFILIREYKTCAYFLGRPACLRMLTISCLRVGVRFFLCVYFFIYLKKKKNWGGGCLFVCLFVLSNAAKLAEFQRFSFQVMMVLFIVTILTLITLVI